ncbi:MAG: hypothetical protein RI894_1375 [Bacteroidota bacterium]
MEQTSSKYNALLEVQMSRGRYMLLTENAIYSYGDLYDNYADSFKQLDLPDDADTEVLILGLGLGSIPQMLEQVWHKKYYYTCVEIDETIIYLAEKYVLKHLKSPMDVIRADALDWVQVTEQLFDIICIDIFVDIATPAEFRENNFLQRCLELLSPNGVLLYNCLGYSEKDCLETERFYHTIFKKTLPNAQIWKLRANYMLVATN